MRDNPDNNTLGNLVGTEADSISDPETPPQSEVARNPDQININKTINKLAGDIKRENDNQLGDEDDEKGTSNVNV